MTAELTRPYSGAQKVALVLLQLGRERAAEVLRQFSEAEAEEIAEQIARMSKVDGEVAQAALREFHERAAAGSVGMRGGREAAEDFIQAAFGSDRASVMIDRLASSMAGRSFEFLDAADPADVANLLDDELPETIAVVLIHLTPKTASAVLGRLEPDVRAPVAQAIATVGTPAPDAVALVAETLRQRARAVVIPREQTEIVGGVQPLVDIINRSDAATEHALLAALEDRDPQLAEDVRARMLTFEDLVRLEPRDVQQVLRGVDPAQLAIAMKGAGAELVEVIRSNMSERNREALEAEIGYLGAVRKTQVDEARAAIVQAIRALEAEGAIDLRRAEEEELIA